MRELQDILHSQGFGTRRVCIGLIQRGWVSVQGELCKDPSALFATPGDPDASASLVFSVQGVEWEFHERAYLMMHKPAGTECSQKPSAHPAVYSLLPAPLRMRPVQRGKGGLAGVQAVGRLDEDTTGLLLLSDDGQFIHRMSSPKHHVPKCYRVRARHPVTAAQVERLLSGVVLDDDPAPVRAAACVQTGDNEVDLTLTEGRYHQVKRMLAAVGNRVDGLHRSSVGALLLDPALAAGQWRWLRTDELALLRSPGGGVVNAVGTADAAKSPAGARLSACP